MNSVSLTLSDPLLLLILVAQLFVILVWWAAGSLLHLSIKATSHWMLGGLTTGIALILYLLDYRLHGSAHNLLADILVVISVITVRRGLQWFLRQPRNEIEHLGIGAVHATISAALFVPLGWEYTSAMMSSLVAIWVLICTIIEARAPLRQEFGAIAVKLIILPLGVAASLLAARVVYTIFPLDSLLPLAKPHQLAQILLFFILELLNIVLNFAWGYIVIMRLIRKLEHLSQHDGLTGLLNRRAMEALLDREAQRLQRFAQPYAIMLIDIDHFKRINDEMGHAVGDQVLKSVAQTLKDQAREVDHVARFGGEEFCVLLPFTEKEGSLQAAERFRSAVRHTPLHHLNRPITITVSIGVASTNDPLESFEKLLQRADQAMYRAKAQGRDRVILAPVPPLNHAHPAF